MYTLHPLFIALQAKKHDKYSQACATLSQFLCLKLKFHHSHPTFAGSLMVGPCCIPTTTTLNGGISLKMNHSSMDFCRYYYDDYFYNHHYY
jgi:hypothetical protein